MSQSRSRLRNLAVGVALLATFPLAWFGEPFFERGPVSLCTFRTLTGHACPFCGLTRAFGKAVHGEFVQAWHYHPLWWIAALVLAGFGCTALCDAATGGDRLARCWRSRLLSGWMVVVMATAFALARWWSPLPNP